MDTNLRKHIHKKCANTIFRQMYINTEIFPDLPTEKKNEIDQIENMYNI